MQHPTITESAKNHINSICKNYSAYAVSLKLKGGGCAGFEYSWNVMETDTAEKDDVEISTGSGKLVIDAFSVPFLENTEIDFVTEMLGSKLIVKNPNVQTACGCGESVGF